MSKIWLVAKREYLYNIQRGTFLFSTFGTPLLIGGMWALIFLLFGNGDDFSEFTQIGYVDNSGLIAVVDLPEESQFTFEAYESVGAAQAALEAETLDAYYIVPEDYLTTGRLERYAFGDAPEDLDDVFQDVLSQNLSQQLEVGFSGERLIDPVDDMTIILQDSGRELTQDAVPVLLLTPMLFAILFSIALQSTGGFLMQGIVKEKTNRILEILVTTITPTQMLIGKIIGLGFVGLTQVVVWILTAVLFFTLAPSSGALSVLNDLPLPWDLFIIGIVYFIFGYFFNGSILAAVGVLAGSEQQSNSYAAIVNLSGYLIPIALLTSFIENSNGTLPTVLSIFPLTSPLSMMLRVGFGGVPLWQIVLSVAVLFLTSLLVAIAAGKLFRWAMLMYGKSFNMRDLTAVIFGNQEMGVTPVTSQLQETTQEGATS